MLKARRLGRVSPRTSGQQDQKHPTVKISILKDARVGMSPGRSYDVVLLGVPSLDPCPPFPPPREPFSSAIWWSLKPLLEEWEEVVNPHFLPWEFYGPLGGPALLTAEMVINDPLPGQGQAALNL